MPAPGLELLHPASRIEITGTDNALWPMLQRLRIGHRSLTVQEFQCSSPHRGPVLPFVASRQLPGFIVCSCSRPRPSGFMPPAANPFMAFRPHAASCGNSRLHQPGGLVPPRASCPPLIAQKRTSKRPPQSRSHAAGTAVSRADPTPTSTQTSRKEYRSAPKSTLPIRPPNPKNHRACVATTPFAHFSHR